MNTRNAVTASAARPRPLPHTPLTATPPHLHTHTGEPGTEVPGCPGTEAATTKIRHKTLSHPAPVGSRPRLAWLPPTHTRHTWRAGYGSARVPRHGCRQTARTQQNAAKRSTRGLPPTARHVAHHTQPRVFTKHHTPPYPIRSRHSPRTIQQTHLPHSGGISRSRDCTPNSHHHSIATLRMLSKTTH